MAAPSEATIEQLAALYEMEPAESESRLRFVQELKQSHTAQGTTFLCAINIANDDSNSYCALSR